MGLQDAIDAAAPGGVVRVPAGRHLEPLVVRKAVTLLGEESVSVIDAGGQGSALLIDAPAGTQIKLYGISFENGVAPAGGGMLLRSGVVLAQRCVFRRCGAPGYGGGAIYASGQELTLERCELTGSQGRQGGGLLLDLEIEARLSCCLISGNRARIGGGIRLKEGAKVVLEGCTVADNAAVGGEGPQVYLSGTMTRTPSLTLYNTILGGPGPVLVNAAEHPGKIDGSHVLLAEADQDFGLGSVVRGDPGFRGGTVPYTLEAGALAAGKGDPKTKTLSRDLLDNERERGGRLDLGAYSLVG